MGVQRLHKVARNNVPRVAVVVIVASEEQLPGLGEVAGGNAADDVLVFEAVELVVRADVKQPAGGVVGS